MLRDGLTQLAIQGIITSDTSICLTTIPHEPDNEYVSLLCEFLSVTLPHIAEYPVKHSVTHHIRTTGPPISSRARRLTPERLKVARQEFEDMLQSGIILPSSSSWSSPSTWSPKRLLGIGDHVGITTL